MKSKIKTTIIFVILGIIFAFTYMQVHEQVHVAILRSYDIPSITQMNWLSASTSPVNQTEYQEKCTPNCIFANNLTDVVGYHTAILIFVLTGLFYISNLFKYRDENKWQEEKVEEESQIK